jgi:hypothetical protein
VITRRGFLGSASAAAVLLQPKTRVEAARNAQPTALRLTAANYVRFMPLATGEVKPANLDLTWIRGDRSEMLRRATSDPQIDGGESSMAQHVVRVDAGDRSSRASVGSLAVPTLRRFLLKWRHCRRTSHQRPQAHL